MVLSACPSASWAADSMGRPVPVSMLLLAWAIVNLPVGSSVQVWVDGLSSTDADFLSKTRLRGKQVSILTFLWIERGLPLKVV